MQLNVYIFLGLPAELKVEMILAQEEKIRKSAELLKDIQVTSCSELKWCPKLELTRLIKYFYTYQYVKSFLGKKCRVKRRRYSYLYTARM